MLFGKRDQMFGSGESLLDQLQERCDGDDEVYVAPDRTDGDYVLDTALEFVDSRNLQWLTNLDVYVAYVAFEGGVRDHKAGEPPYIVLKEEGDTDD